MATTGLVEFLTRVRGGPAADVPTDADLVRDYVESRSQVAFNELVRRFAPMVWGVCRRTVGDRQRAEDAFQAVFLVLIRKPAAVRPPAAVGAWLHAVAVHTSLRARAAIGRRRRWEALGPTIPERAVPEIAESLDPDHERVLDEEIARLPDKLRAAVVLCELDGVNRRDAAKRLGIAEGTLSSRLAAARQQLAARLRGRGVALGVGLGAFLGTGPATAAPPVRVPSSETVSALAEGAIRTMFLTRLKKFTAIVLAAVALVGVGLTAYSGETSEPPPAVPVRHAGPVPVPKVAPEGPPRAGTILIWVDEKPHLLNANGTARESPDPIPKVHFGVGSGLAQLSPDGTKVAFHMQGPAFAKPPQPPANPAGVPGSRMRTTLKILDLGGKKETKALDSIHLNDFCWMGGGNKLYVRGYEIGADDAPSQTLESWVYEPATDKRTPLKVPEDFCVRAIGPDGKTALVDEWKMTPNQWHQRAHLWTVGTDKPVPLLELNQSVHSPTPKFSPDGKRLLGKVVQYGKHTPQGNGTWTLDEFKCNNVVVIDLATKKQSVVKALPEEPEWDVHGLAWSPDGKKIAYLEAMRVPAPPPGMPGGYKFRIVVADPDGANAKTIHMAEGNWLVGFDWK